MLKGRDMRLSAETIIEHISRVDAIQLIKERALTISAQYENNVKIEINATKDGIVKMNITEYNL